MNIIYHVKASGGIAFEINISKNRNVYLDLLPYKMENILFHLKITSEYKKQNKMSYPK